MVHIFLEEWEFPTSLGYLLVLTWL